MGSRGFIRAKFVVATPMFLGESPTGDQQVECAETIRGASVKGALRAHFRSLNWGRIRNDSASNNEALKILHQEESAIFGSAVRDGKGGQAQFLMRIKSDELKLVKELSNKNSAVEYLLGMGLYSKEGMLRSHIPADT